MAIVKHTITDTAWVAITSAGQSGSAWFDENTQDNGMSSDVRIVHGATVPTDEDIEKGKRVYVPEHNNDVVILSADNHLDIFYARAAVDGNAILSVDVA